VTAREFAATLTYSRPFFFSSRRRHTRFKCDWSSDVCSSDLNLVGRDARGLRVHPQARGARQRSMGRQASAGQERRGVDQHDAREIGRASCRERVGMTVGGGGEKEKTNDETETCMPRWYSWGW